MRMRQNVLVRVMVFAIVTAVMLFAFTFAFTFAAASYTYTYTEGTAPILKVDNRTDAYIGELVKINISLTEAPSGVSGYNISVALSNASVAEIESIELPDWGINFLSKNSTMPAHSVWVRAIDLGMQIEENATNIPIVTLLVRTKSDGTTAIYISRLRIDDDFDRRINPIIENGSIYVSTSGSSISGFITYACNETGLAGATVNLSLSQPGNGNGNETPAIKSTVTDSNGSYKFISVYPGTYNITASKRGFWSNFTSVTVTGAPASESYTLNLALWLKGDLNNNVYRLE